MAKVSIRVRNFDEVQRLIKNFPQLIERANISALQSTGFFMRKAIKEHLQTGGSGQFKQLHPLRKELRTTKTGRWAKRSNPRPLSALARYARYFVDKKKSEVHATLRATKDFEKNTFSSKFDKSLVAITRKHEFGATISMSEKALDFVSKGLAKAGLPFFKRSKNFVVIPRRAIIGPVFRKLKVKIFERYRNKFISNIKKKSKEFV